MAGIAASTHYGHGDLFPFSIFVCLLTDDGQCIYQFVPEGNQLTSLKFLPVVAGYRMDSFSFLSGPMMKTARAVRGMPALSISSGSNMPYLQHTEAACILCMLLLQLEHWRDNVYSVILLSNTHVTTMVRCGNLRTATECTGRSILCLTELHVRSLTIQLSAFLGQI